MCLVLEFLEFSECLELGGCVFRFGIFGIFGMLELGDCVFSFGIFGIIGIFGIFGMFGIGRLCV